MLYSLPLLRAEGWNVKVWCLRSDIPKDEAEHVLFPAAEWLGPFQLFYFTLIVNLYGFWRWGCGRPRPAQIIHATSGTFFGADLVSVQFINSLWLRFQMKAGLRSAKDLIKLAFVLVGILFEKMSWLSPSLLRVLAVSTSIADEMRRLAPRVPLVETLPNSYDETRFNPAVRDQYREPTRARLGLGSNEVVFAFLSTGHYERKGFWLAVDALALVRSKYKRTDLNFLVIGGAEAALAQLRSQLQARHPGFSDWIIFAGQQPRVEEYLAAADAFLYPSYFEAFCLAEIEAAVMGIPLLITRHYGSEMILKDGINGLSLEWDHARIAERICHFLLLSAKAFQLDAGNALARAQYAETLLAIYNASLGGAM